MLFLKLAYYALCLACFGSVVVGLKWLMEAATLRKILMGLLVATLAAGMVDMWLHTPMFKGIPYAVVCLLFAKYEKHLAGRKGECS